MLPRRYPRDPIPVSVAPNARHGMAPNAAPPNKKFRRLMVCFPCEFTCNALDLSYWYSIGNLVIFFSLCIAIGGSSVCATAWQLGHRSAISSSEVLVARLRRPIGIRWWATRQSTSSSLYSAAKQNPHTSQHPFKLAFFASISARFLLRKTVSLLLILPSIASRLSAATRVLRMAISSLFSLSPDSSKTVVGSAPNNISTGTKSFSQFTGTWCGHGQPLGSTNRLAIPGLSNW